MKKRFHYDTCRDAFEALNTTIITDTDFDWDSIQQVGFWLNEFIRDTDEDLNWLNIVINTIGHDCSTIKYWFSLQSEDSESWTESSYKLICEFADLLND